MVSSEESRSLARATWIEIEKSIRTGRITKAILPVGSLEQHGPHLPLSTDTMIADYVAEKVSKKCPDTIKLPTIQLGCSAEHVGFAGTLSIEPETMSRIILDISSSLVKSKLSKFFIVNGHGGNRAVLDSTIGRVKEAFPEMHAYCFTIIDIAKQKFDEIRKSNRRFVGHADEIETSMMLAIKPDLVDMSKALSEEPMLPKALSFEPEDLARVSFAWNARDLSKSGVMGNPLLASAQDGRILIEFAVDAISTIMNEL